MSAYQKSAPVWLGVLLVAGFATVTVGQPGDLWDPLPPGYSLSWGGDP